MDIKIVFHPSGDWEGLYVEGYLECEGHSIRVEDLIEALNRVTISENRFPEGSNFKYSTRDLGNEEGFDVDFDFPLKYEDIKPE